MSFNNSIVAVVILNWNNWLLTCNCLNSVINQNYSKIKIIICDNGSSDGSLGAIVNELLRLKNNELPDLIYECVDSFLWINDGFDKINRNSNVFVVANDDNLGFAGGNNVGIKFALMLENVKYIWLLNNDTEVDPDALTNLVDRMERDTKLGICGSVLLDFFNKNEIQAVGCQYNKWFGIIKVIGAGSSIEKSELLVSSSLPNIDYPVGASLLVSSSYISTIGSLGEEYFLYFEELDWIVRGRDSFNFSIAPNSFVYHHEGASAGSNKNYSKRSLRSEFYIFRSKIIFAKKHYPKTIPTIYIGLMASVVLRIFRFRWKSANIICQIILKRGNINFNPDWL